MFSVLHFFSRMSTFLFPIVIPAWFKLLNKYFTFYISPTVSPFFFFETPIWLILDNLIIFYVSKCPVYFIYFLLYSALS